MAHLRLYREAPRCSQPRTETYAEELKRDIQLVGYNLGCLYGPDFLSTFELRSNIFAVFSASYGGPTAETFLTDHNLLHPPAPNPSIGLKVAL
jgi:hypothetical protein